MVKGITQHVIPYSEGWAVYEDRRPDTFHFFREQEEAMRYAREKAKYCETPVLIHMALPVEPEQITLLVMGCESSPAEHGCQGHKIGGIHL